VLSVPGAVGLNGIGTVAVPEGGYQPAWLPGWDGCHDHHRSWSLSCQTCVPSNAIWMTPAVFGSAFPFSNTCPSVLMAHVLPCASEIVPPPR
jgi:hypothetical protein